MSNHKEGNSCRKIRKRSEASDRIYTPKKLAIDMINMCDIKPTDNVLDPSLGDGIFYNNFPKCNKDWCEIDKGRDFFEYTKGKKYDWVIGNPPYSIWTKWMKHTAKITDKVCYIFGLYNLTPPRVDEMKKMGFGITSMMICKVDWWFSPSWVVIFEKNKPSVVNVIRDRYKCDICNKRCKRGQTYKGKKYGMNECSNVT